MQTLQLTISNRIASLTLNRPESLNSFNGEMHADFKQALADIKKSDARVLLITGNGKGFCAGQDLSDRKVSETTADLGDSLEERYNPLIRALTTLELPIVCAVNGVAAGAGVSLALCADIIIMHKRASLVLAFSKIGLVPDSGCSWLLTHAIGWRRARALSLMGGRISSAQAYDWGLAWAIYEDEEFEDETRQLCETLAKAPTKGLAYTKRLFSRAAIAELHTQLDDERDYQRLAGRTEDYREGVSAFFDKREPQFNGK
ncbi:MAG: 2-(1,2-epoxy-1,2-dihydrophenyl)acetyl-CoA isomerase PaaG [Proteobacteria bacterium]|nr:2-(1,2-epoxy-1,2-dihydrophenyl)acetyl-CoA isomerase PaaG [Pseudomonadota bacterium]